MTDTEIVKALECCPKSKTRGDCERMACPACVDGGCAYVLRSDEDHYTEGLIKELHKDALSLINRQKAEIERLEELLEGWKKAAYKAADEKDEIYCNAIERVKVAKAEAIKEFEDKLFELFPDDKNFTTISRMTVKHIAKKVVGDDDA